MNIVIYSNDWLDLGAYILKVTVWDGGDGTYAKRVNEITDTPTLPLTVYDPRQCVTGTVTANVILDPDNTPGCHDADNGNVDSRGFGCRLHRRS